jgi:DNA-directed RNA polymerase subunit RPC12/RpoP
MSLLEKLRLTLRWGRLLVGFDTKTVSTGNDGFVCVDCGAEFRRQQYQCPECGGWIVVPTEETEAADQNRQRPF